MFLLLSAIVGWAFGWWAKVLLVPRPPVAPGRVAQSVFFGACVAVFFFTLLHSFAALTAYAYALDAFLLDPRILTFLAGIAFGFWASRYRNGIGRQANAFYTALLGAENKSSWALQSAVAIVALLGILLVIKPDLLDNLESLKAGEVEAKFSTLSARTREAVRVNLRDFINSDTGFDDFYDFRNKFLQDRDLTVRFDNSKVKDLRRTIRNTMLEYIEPWRC